jgi:hypothetical protein
MARLATDDVLDNGLDALKAAIEADTGMMTICEGAPTTYEHASAEKGTATGKVLAKIAGTDAALALTLADDTSGRKATISAVTGLTILQSGNADHIALASSDGSKLWFVTTCTEQALVSGGTVDIPAWKINVQDPTAPA